MKKFFRKTVALMALTVGMALPLMACVYDPHYNFGAEAMVDPGGTVVTTFMDNLVAGNTLAATMMMSAEMQQLFPIDLVITLRQGEVLDFVVLDTVEADGFHVSTVSATVAKGASLYSIAVNDAGEIAGFSILDFAFEPMMPPQDATYTAEGLIIGDGGEWPLDALLTIPQNASVDSPVPAVILVPGSGPNNMDSSIFANRPFFDIADYLSSNGIAVLRYNERIFAHGARMVEVFGMDYTLQEEYFEDVLLATELLRNDNRISEIFVLGLSQGGLVAPRIAEEAGLDGVIIMNGSPRPLHLVGYDQMTQQVTDALVAGLISQDEADVMFAMNREQLDEMQTALNLPASELQGVLFFGAISAIYELSVMESLPLPFIARNTEIPVLILHGSRDFQATVESDFRLFVDGTEGMGHVTLILYEGLNHLMMTAYRQYGPLVMDIMEYAIQDRVDAQVKRDIVDWINSNTN